MRPAVAVALALLLVTAGCSGLDPAEESPTSTGPSVVTESGAAPDADPASQTPTAAGARPTGEQSPARTDSPSAESTASSATVTATATSGPTDDEDAAASPTAAPADGRTATVVRVVDGDTLEIRYENGSEDTVRLLGVDTPEVHAENQPEEWEGVPNTDAGRDCLRAAGHDASDRVKQRLAGETVRLEFDDSEGRRGYYGRLLAYVFHEGEHVNYRLVADGDARVYDSQFERRDRFYAAEDDARSQRLGAWECRDAATATATASDDSADGGRSLAVATVHADADGNDHENENGEYVVFENEGDEALDLSGWTVRDEADREYVVPDGFTLASGATVTLYTGSGEDDGDELYWGSDSAVWNNGGDTVTVRAASGEVVLRHEY